MKIGLGLRRDPPRHIYTCNIMRSCDKWSQVMWQQCSWMASFCISVIYRYRFFLCFFL